MVPGTQQELDKHLLQECLAPQICALSNLSLLPFLFLPCLSPRHFPRRHLLEQTTSALQPAHCVILGKSPPLPWSGFLHQQNGYKNLCCSAPYLWCKGQMRTCEELIAKQQKAFCTQAGEEAAAEAIHEALGLHPRGFVFEEGLSENALGKRPSSSLSGKAWCSCSICELKLFLGSITAIMTGPLPEGEGWGVDLSHRWGGQAAQANLRVPMEVRPITPTPQITPGLCLPQIVAPKRAVGRATCSRKD